MFVESPSTLHGSPDPASGPDGEFRRLADAMPQIVWFARPDGTLCYCNTQVQAYSGVVSDQALGQGWLSILHPDDIAPTTSRWTASLASGETYESHFRLRRADGEHRWFLARALPYRDPAGNITRWFGTCTDIHDQKMAEAAVLLAKEQSDRNGKAKDEFLSVLSHELRTPLSAILGWVQLLEMGVLDDVETKDAISTIKQQAKVQSQLIEDLLEVSRIINGKFHMRQETVPLTAVFDRVLETIGPSATDKRVVLQRKIWDTGVQIQGDPQRIQQLAWNLISNAVKFTPAGGKITVEIKAKGDLAEIDVCDTGKGIDSEQLARIFDTFNQADSTHTRSQGGLGLGLSIVRHIVRMHRGTIDATSKGVDCGSEFIVRMPRLMSPTALDAPMPVRPLGFDALAGLVLLVADDEESARVVAEASLRKFGAHVESAASAGVALELLRNGHHLDGRHFDVLISDIGMPGMSGLDLIKHIRNGPLPLSQLPAIALTAFASVDDQSRALDAGFNSHVSKPLDATELVRQVLRIARS